LFRGRLIELLIKKLPKQQRPPHCGPGTIRSYKIAPKRKKKREMKREAIWAHVELGRKLGRQFSPSANRNFIGRTTSARQLEAGPEFPASPKGF
jgi:hypothetical protein